MAKSKTERFKSREEWLKARGIGGSDIGAIMGLTSFKSIDDVFLDKVFGSKDEKSEVMERGTKAESHIRDLFALSTYDEFKVQNPPKGNWIVRHSEFPYMTCSPDGLLTDLKTGKKGGLEIKFVDLRSKAQREKWDNKIPDNYYAQAAWYMAVMPELEFVILCAYQKFYENYEDGWKFDHAEMKLYPIYRDEAKDFIKAEIEKAKEFHECVVNKLLPSETLTIRKEDL